ncbi:T7SS effector LXG polymorphic toxin [Bacillus pseudomycoides]|uniref:T7SS effector LXG polymorphic toxin n=1 Tax=Bacillus pseudomycoides TaxID=64104 RepID=UPI003CED63B9
MLQAQNKLSNLQPKKHELDSRISNIYNSVSDLISLSMPKSQFDEKLVAASKELEDTIQKVQQFESKKAESNAENILNALNKQVQIAGDMGSLSYTDPQLRAFFAQDALAKGIHEMDTQITNAEKEAKLEAEREMKKKQEEWAENHPLEAWLQDLSKSAGEKWDVLRKGTKWVGDNIPLLKDLSDKALVLEGFIGAAGSAISGIAIGATKLGFLIAELGEWGFNSIRGVETEQWKLDDIYGAGNTIKSLGQAIISWQDYPKYGKALVNSVKGYVEKALTDPYALGGAIFDIGSCFIGVGEVTAAVKGTAAFGKFAEGTKVFQAAAKSGKIVGKLEEITALMNKLPRNALEKIKNIEIPSFGPKTALASAGHGGGGGLDSLKDVYQSMKENGKEFFGKATGEGRGLDSLKDVYQFMKENGEKVFGKGTGDTDHPIRTYRDVDLQNIDPVYIASQRTVVEMPFGGKGEKYTNAEGWRRDLKYFWRELLDRHPEAFSPNNRAIIEGRNPFTDSPVNDKVFREYFSQYDVKGVRGDKLVHHHIGGGGQAFPVPQKLHPGSGGIHNIEKEAGIWGKDKVYSELLQKLIKE